MDDDDQWDPVSLFAPSPLNFRIYGDMNAQVWCEVSEEDYQWAVQWRWHVNLPHKTRFGKKHYFTRNSSNGRRWGPKLYLHAEIMKRSGTPQPTPEHSLVDHIDGNEWNNRRDNLRWATHTINNGNIKNVGPSLRY